MQKAEASVALQSTPLSQDEPPAIPRLVIIICRLQLEFAVATIFQNDTTSKLGQEFGGGVGLVGFDRTTSVSADGNVVASWLNGFFSISSTFSSLSLEFWLPPFLALVDFLQ